MKLATKNCNFVGRLLLVRNWRIQTIRIITCNVPESFLRAINNLTGKNGIYPSRSELIRLAVREWLIRELESAQAFEDFQNRSNLVRDDNIIKQSKIDNVYQYNKNKTAR